MTYVFTSTYWLLHQGIIKATIYWMVYSLLQFLPFLIINLRVLKNRKEITFISIYLLFEIVMHNKYIGMPWLCLGNCLAGVTIFANFIKIFGLIILSTTIILVNYAIYNLTYKKLVRKKLFYFLGLFSISLLGCHFTASSNQKLNKSLDCISYNSKFYSTKNRGYDARVVEKLINYLYINPPKNDLLIILPEVFLEDYIFLNDYKLNTPFLKLLKITEKFNKIEILVGSVIAEYAPIEQATIIDTSLNVGLKKYNASLSLRNGKINFVKYKEHLTPFYEYTPKFLSSLFKKSQFLTFKDNETNIFNNDSYIYKPYICYEICYGNLFPFFCYEKNKFDFAVMTASEPLMHTKATKKQYTNMAKLRAIENNVPIIKVAYEGENCLIEPNGKITYLDNSNDTIIKYKFFF